jgi:hypothetical protein
MEESAADIREQSQKAVGHAQPSAQYGRESDTGLDHRTRESADWRLLHIVSSGGGNSHVKVDSNSYALYADLFEIAGGLVSEHDAEFMDTLWHCASGTELARIDVVELYFAELFRRSRYLAQLCQAGVYEGMREDVCGGRHRDCFCLTSGDGLGDVDNGASLT